MAEWRENAARGERVTKFLQSDVWLKDIEPYLLDEQNKTIDGRRWSPALKMPIDQFGQFVAYLSGTEESLGRIAVKLSEWVSVGKGAETSLKMLEAKK